MVMKPASKKKPSKTKSKDKKKKKASFKVHRRGKGLKAGKPRDDEVNAGESDFKYKGVYTLDHLPPAAWPDTSKANQGTHSYTLTSPSGNKARIEVLLRHNAFFVKRVGEDAPGPVGQVSFARFNGAAGAWSEATRRAGWG